MCIRRDGKTFNHQTLEAICLVAVERVPKGERVTDVILQRKAIIAGGRLKEFSKER